MAPSRRASMNLVRRKLVPPLEGASLDGPAGTAAGWVEVGVDGAAAALAAACASRFAIHSRSCA